MKKLVPILLILILSISISCIDEPVYSTPDLESKSEYKTTEILQAGDYITFGKYNDESIIWRYINYDGGLEFSDDSIFNDKDKTFITRSNINNNYVIWDLNNNELEYDSLKYSINPNSEMLLYSDNILCFKEFNENIKQNEANNFWESSSIRNWLNSNKTGEFLSGNNFTNLEKSIIKKSDILTYWPKELISDDIKNIDICQVFDNKYGYTGSHSTSSYSIIPRVGYMLSGRGGCKKISKDRIFLLDEGQIYNIFKKFGSASTEVANALKSEYDMENFSYAYWLRSPYNYDTYYSREADVNDSNIGEFGCIISGEKPEETIKEYTYPYGGHTIKVGDKYSKCKTNEKNGIRPAFFLNKENAVILGGSGVKEDPYILGGKTAIIIRYNSIEIDLLDQPTIKDGIVMIPSDEVFEAVGCEVSRDEVSQAVTYKYKDNYIYMIPDNKGIMINGEIFDMGYPMTIIDETAYVPLTAIELSIASNVKWDNEAYQIDVLID